MEINKKYQLKKSKFRISDPDCVCFFVAWAYFKDTVRFLSEGRQF